MWVLEFLNDGNVVKLDVEVLVYALERAAQLDIILEFHGDLVVYQGFEEASASKLIRCSRACMNRGR